MSGPFVLVPLTITTAMLSSSTAPEPSATETVWNAATSYTVGQEVILTSTHKVYMNLIAGVDATPPNLAIYVSTPRWLESRSTNTWMAFDTQISTQTLIASPLTFVITPGFFNAIALYGLLGTSVTVNVKDAPGGAVVFTSTIDLTNLPVDAYDYYFGPIKATTKAFFQDITPYANPEITITISAAAGSIVGVGMVAIGDLRALVSIDGSGGTQYGAKAKPVTYSYIKTDVFGTTSIIKRNKSTDMDIRVVVPNEDTDSALSTIQEVLDVPAAWIGSEVAGRAGLNVFGLASGDVSYEGPNHSIITINIKGLI